MSEYLNYGEDPHRCRPPMKAYSVALPSSWAPDKKTRTTEYYREPPVGTVWRCECGVLWEVVPNHYRNVMKEGDWVRADLWTRFKYRNK